MAYFEDLTPYQYFANEPPAVNVGWLSLGHPYNKGRVATDLVEALREVAVANRRNQTRGYHTCELCKDQKLSPGNNLHVQGAGSQIRFG